MHMSPVSQKRKLRPTEAKETAGLAASHPDWAVYFKRDGQSVSKKCSVQHLVCVAYGTNETVGAITADQTWG